MQSWLAAIACIALLSVGSGSAHAQVAQGHDVVVEPAVSDTAVRFLNLEVSLDPFTFRPAKHVSSPAGMAMRSNRSPQATTSTRSGTRARSTTRVVFGAIVGAVGGFFAGGFLGAHIEGDRCDCDDPGVRGFLIGAPIGAAAGGIVGAKFLF